MSKKIIYAYFAGAASAIIAYLLTEKIVERIKKRSQKRSSLPSYPLKAKDPHAWGEYTL